MKQGRKIFVICGLGSILVLLFNMFFLKNAGENIISDLISAGQLNKEYLTKEGWFYDYSTIDAHCIATGIFILIFYGVRIFLRNNGRLAVALLILYPITEVIIIANFVHFALLIGVPVLLILLLAMATFKFSNTIT